MITRIKLREFQAHKSLEITPDAGVTSIVGPSDAGKSAILRALRLVAVNEPAGEAYIRDGAVQCVVTVELDEHKVTRRRGNGTNSYSLDGTTFEAFGKSELPEPVCKLLNVDDINFQGQYDSPFWLAESAGEVSRQLNRVVSLQSIDDVLSRLASALRECRAALAYADTQSSEATANAAKYAHVGRMDAELRTVEAKQAQLAEVDEIADALSTATQQTKEANTKHNAASAKAKDALGFLSLLSELESCEREAGAIAQKLQRLDELRAVRDKPIPDLKVLTQSYDSWVEAKQRVDTLHGVITTVVERRVTMQSKEESHEATEAEFRKHMGKVCKLCGAKL